MSVPVDATPGEKMRYLIRRKGRVSKEESAVHWCANHMPRAISAQRAAAERGGLPAWRYIATLFQSRSGDDEPRDGIAELWWDRPLLRTADAHGKDPTDAFQEKAEPYLPWPTVECVVLDGSEHLAGRPNTLNDPFPCTRSGHYKVTFLVAAKVRADFEAFSSHWLNVQLLNGRCWMQEAGGFPYVIDHSSEPELEPCAGMAEVYFQDVGSWEHYRKASVPDGMERWVDADRLVVLPSVTGMVGIP